MHGIRGKINFSGPCDSAKLYKNLFENRRIPKGREYPGPIVEYQTRHDNDALRPV